MKYVGWDLNQNIRFLLYRNITTSFLARDVIVNVWHFLSSCYLPFQMLRECWSLLTIGISVYLPVPCRGLSVWIPQKVWKPFLWLYCKDPQKKILNLLKRPTHQSDFSSFPIVPFLSLSSIVTHTCYTSDGHSAGPGSESCLGSKPWCTPFASLH